MGWDWVEAIGIIAGCIILLSFLMKEVKWIRIVNIFGAIGMVIYGILIESISTIFLNGGLIIIQVIFLIKIIKDEKKLKESDAN